MATIKGVLLKIANEKRGFSLFSDKGIETLKGKVKEVWLSEFPDERAPERAGGVDGSRFRVSYAGYLVYALGAVSVIFEGSREVETEVEGDLDVLSPEEFSDSRLRILMGILEYKRVLSTLSKVSVVFVDGSIVGALLRPNVFVYRSPLRERVKSYVEELFGELKEEFSLNEIKSKRFYQRISRDFGGEDFAFACGYLEYLEYLYTLYLLLKEAEKSGKTIISVSKTSNSRIYNFHSVSPDITVLAHVNPPPGYSKPSVFALEREEKFVFPSDFDSLLRKFSFCEFFIKLKEGKGFYKVEVFPSSKVPESISYLRYYGTGGYNYLLKTAHERVKISARDMENAVKVMNFKGVTGREALGE